MDNRVDGGPNSEIRATPGRHAPEMGVHDRVRSHRWFDPHSPWGSDPGVFRQCEAAAISFGINEPWIGLRSCRAPLRIAQPVKIAQSASVPIESPIGQAFDHMLDIGESGNTLSRYSEMHRNLRRGDSGALSAFSRHTGSPGAPRTLRPELGGSGFKKLLGTLWQKPPFCGASDRLESADPDRGRLSV